MPKVLNKRRAGVPAGAVYVGRPSKWGNPFSLNDWDRSIAVELYASWLNARMAEDPAFVEPLRGKDLVCWCAPLPCHADILIDVANR